MTDGSDDGCCRLLADVAANLEMSQVLRHKPPWFCLV
jgi:hypothetical protein